MLKENKNILITGIPGIGKTTLIIKLASMLKDKKLAGFYTSEIREAGIRRGFELEDFSGNRRILSHVNIKSSFQVGKYRVDVNAFDKFLDKLDLLNPNIHFILIDEIGKMESFSSRFKELIQKVLDSDKRVIATIALKGSGIIEQIKKRNDVELIEITLHNRGNILSQIYQMIGD